MPGNSIGQIFTISTFGESHGSAIGVVIDGVVPGVRLCEADVQVELDRRRPGQSALTTPRSETDTVEILSGVFEGRATGTPIALLIRNTDSRSRDYEKIRNIFRPGHADFGYAMKFGLRDHRGGGRASGRETAARVAAGAVAKKILAARKIAVTAYTRAIGTVVAKKVDFAVIEKNPVRCPDCAQAKKMIALIQQAQRAGDSLGGIVEAVVTGCPAGIGDPVFDKLNARLAHAVMSIGTAIGVEFGIGFTASGMRGSKLNDGFHVKNGAVCTRSAHAGGILGGISTGSDITLRVALKPPPSISQPQETVTVQKKKATIQITGRHDPCVCPRAVPVVEAMVAVTILDCLMIQDAIRPQRKP